MRHQRRSRIGLILLLVSCGLFAVGALIRREILRPEVRFADEIRASEALVEEVEAYRANHGGQLPDEDTLGSRSKPGLGCRLNRQGVCLIYATRGDYYYVAFQTDFDDVHAFDSRTKDWSFFRGQGDLCR